MLKGYVRDITSILATSCQVPRVDGLPNGDEEIDTLEEKLE
jgi:hypothetical protein